jgi:hypothetical protein
MDFAMIDAKNGSGLTCSSESNLPTGVTDSRIAIKMIDESLPLPPARQDSPGSYQRLFEPSDIEIT